ncbi:MAG TPA: metallophosphoesterase [Gallionella sp.]|nr:metallophosphoesterase [Gallionella sp.]
MRNKLTWLHISDIHFHPKTEWRDSASRSALLNHLKNIFLKNESLRPDLIFCTGDIAFGEHSLMSLSSQYSQAKTFFDDLLSACGSTCMPLPKERLFVVPGNHDVNRKSINTDAQSTLTTWATQANDHVNNINQRFNDRTTEFKDAIKRLDEYAQFVKDYLPHQHDADGRHHYASISDINNLKVGIAGFNSAWTCAGSEDDRNIWLAANWQFDRAQQVLKDADIRIGLMHHPVDWLNSADRNITTHRIASDYDFWLHGHSHNAWITPVQSHIIVAAGAIGAQTSEEFGINLASIDLAALKGVIHLHNKKSGSNWTIAPVEPQAPTGLWNFDLPTRLRKESTVLQQVAQNQEAISSVKQDQVDFVDRQLTRKLEYALRAFSSQPNVWVSPIICSKSEIAPDAKSEPRVDLSNFVANPKSTIIKAPPQYGQTCLAHFLVRQAWRTQKSLWLYLDSKDLKPHASSINEAISNELKILACSEQDIKCVILDSWSTTEKDAFKLLKNLCDRFKNVPVVCMQQVDIGLFKQIDNNELERQFEVLYLWSLPREDIRKIVAAYNDIKHIGDEDAVTTRLASDLEVLNLHRTPLNCLTLLKVSEIDFEESPVNRSEMIKRVLFLLFNVDDIPTYKSRPDLKDCEYVLGNFCELLIRDGTYAFTRDKFLLETQKCCQERLIDLETQVVFDVLFANNILVKRGSFFWFKFSYWIFYFAAQRMHHDQNFANYIFEHMRYAQHPELIEFYTGIDRRRDDALQILIKDIKACSESIKNKCGLPEGLNPYEFATWKPSPETEAQMQQVIADGVLESTLPAAIKDQFADRTYDQTRPYDQSIAALLTEHSFTSMMQTMHAGARALRNSDYVSPDIKRQLLGEILNCWEQASKVLFIVLPILAEKGHAVYDGAGFILAGDFGDTPQQRFTRILCEIPNNVVSWCQDDLFSRKMGPLLIDQLGNKEIGDISRHELILLLIHQRPRDWSKQVQRYIATNKKNSFYLFDVYQSLRTQYRYSFASPQTLREIEHLIRMAATKHVTGDKEPGVKAINKLIFKDDVIPPREV